MPHLTVADWIGIISFLVAIELAVGHGTVSLTNAVPEKWVPRVQAWCNILAFVGSSLVAVLSRMALVAVMVVLMLGAGQVLAQDRRLAPTIHLPLPIPNPLAPAASSTATTTPGEGPLGQALAKVLSAPFQQIADLINSDIDGAIKLSTKIPSLQDGNGQQCWMAMKQFGDVVKAHPLPLTGKAITDLEAARLMAMAANNLCHVQQCTQVFADLSNAVTVAAQKIPGAGAVQAPSLNSLCSAVPVVVVAPPVSTPAAAPATTPANP